MSELLWVAVPNGLRPADKASIRVLVVPRLTGVDIARGRPGGLAARWPRRPAFTLRTRTSLGERIAVAPASTTWRGPGSEVWAGFFGGDAGLVERVRPQDQPGPDGRADLRGRQDGRRDLSAVTRAPPTPPTTPTRRSGRRYPAGRAGTAHAAADYRSARRSPSRLPRHGVQAARAPDRPAGAGTGVRARSSTSPT